MFKVFEPRPMTSENDQCNNASHLAGYNFKYLPTQLRIDLLLHLYILQYQHTFE